jgi:CRP/FNR family cyclic AMP-dependent transcriptional regulator
MKRRTPPVTRLIGTLLQSQGGNALRYASATIVFAQGERCAGLMYIDGGRVTLTATSPSGRKAVLAVLGPGAFFGEGAMAGQRLRTATAETTASSTITQIGTAGMRRAMLHSVTLSDSFRAHLLTRNARIQADVVTHVFNSIERRLARALLLLSGADERGAERYPLPLISRRLLAEMIGATRGRVDVLMNRFTKLGFLERHSGRNGGLQVHRSMLSVVLKD